MTNADLKRFYETNTTMEKKDFVRLNSNGKIDDSLLPDMPKRIIVEDVETLSSGIIELLKCGDVVIKNIASGSQHAYLVAYRKETEMSLVYTDHENVEEVYYEKGLTGWAHIVTDTTHIGN